MIIVKHLTTNVKSASTYLFLTLKITAPIQALLVPCHKYVIYDILWNSSIKPFYLCT